MGAYFAWAGVTRVVSSTPLHLRIKVLPLDQRAARKIGLSVGLAMATVLGGPVWPHNIDR